jgi:DNA invertase Pin-like site-specific DNA recombinase
VSGSNGLDARIGLYEAVTAVQEQDVGGLVVHRLDRLARDLILQETLIGMIQAAGGSLFSTVEAENALLTSGDHADDPARRMVRQVLGAVAEYERAVIRLRLRSGKLAKKARGGYVGGRVPHGFVLSEDGTMLVPSEHERAAVERMRALRDQGVTWRHVCETLTEEGHRPKQGGDWHPSVVMRIVRRAERDGDRRT